MYIRTYAQQSFRSVLIHAVQSVSSLGAFWIAKDAKFLHANNKDFDQIALMCMLILYLYQVHMSEGVFSHVVVHLLLL